MSGILSGATLLLALGSGLVTGVLWAFSSFIMRALAQVPSGAETMQRIDVVIYRSGFIPLFMIVALASLVLLIYVLFTGLTPASTWLLAGSLLYLVGVFGVTTVFNVPLNTQLAAAPADALAEIWANYLRVWTFWNTVRTVAGVGSSLAFILAYKAL